MAGIRERIAKTITLIGMNKLNCRIDHKLIRNDELAESGCVASGGAFAGEQALI